MLEVLGAISEGLTTAQFPAAILILQLMEVSQFYGQTLLDKFRYLPVKLSRRCSIIHWSYDLLPETLI